MKASLLVVDDEPGIVELLRGCLEGAGYSVVTALNGAEGLRAFYRHRPDLVLLDIIMPGMDGLQVCQRIREMSQVPVIFLSAKGTEEDRVRGLNLGADDYIVKPVGMKELLARVEAALRRARMPSLQETETFYRDSLLTVDLAAHQVFLRGEETELTPLEYSLLLYLVRNAGRVLTTEQLLDHVWGKDYYSPDAVKWYISQLRRKIEADPANPRFILTVRGVGYRYQKPPPEPPPPQPGVTPG